LGVGTFQIAPQGCFIAPSNLKAGGNPYAFAGNLSFEGGSQIPYNPVDFVSVFSNAQIPDLTSSTSYGITSAIEDSTVTAETWYYTWSSDTLLLTHASTYESGTSTLTTRTITSGTFGELDPYPSTFYSSTNGPWGGSPAVNTAPVSVWFPPRAVKGTVINHSADSSSTYRTLIDSTASSEISETVVTESQIPAFVVWTVSQDNPATMDFPRNLGG
jgi:hypothetical protein